MSLLHLNNALDDLHDAAADLYRRGNPPLAVFRSLARLAALYGQLGARLPAGLPLTLTREVCGLPGWDPWPESSRESPRLSKAVIDEIDTTPPGLTAQRQEAERHRRALVLAGWLLRHAGSLLADEVVLGASKLMARVATEAQACGRTTRHAG